MRILALLILFLGCVDEQKQSAEPKADLNVLFIGNSLTYVNDLPALVSEIAKMDGVDLAYKTYALPNFAIEDHWAANTIQKGLKEDHYDFLIAQQGPSAQSQSQIMLRNASVMVANECRKTKTTFGLYMVWPSADRSTPDHDRCIESYTKAAKASNALLCPAALAWKLAWKNDPDLPLYGPDGFHPGIHGSVLAAMSIYASIKQKTNLDFIDKSKATWSESISDEQMTIMKDAAILAEQQK